MKKKVIFLVLTLVFCIGCFNLGKLFKADVLDNDIKESNSLKNLSSLNILSMMLETEAGSGEYVLETRSSWPAKDDGYVFNEELSKCESGSTLYWNEENNVVVMSGSISDKCYVYFDVYSVSVTLAEYVISQYTGVQGSNNIYYHDSSLENGAGDNSYRYSGSSSSVNNYVCFGSDDETCPDDNLYRIIGVFDSKVRLIKADYATSDMLGTGNDYYGTYDDNTSYYQGESSNLTNIAAYYWNKENYISLNTYNNDWSSSELNRTHINKNYLDYLYNINTKWTYMIENTTWKVGGNTHANMFKSNAKTAYASEITSPSNQVTNTYESKIGLMYVSDYAYAASPSAWTTTLENYNGNDASENKITEENWMYMGLGEMTMTRSSSTTYYTYLVVYTGFVDLTIVNAIGSAVRPVFHLLSSVKYVSGDGSKNLPIRIKID